MSASKPWNRRRRQRSFLSTAASLAFLLTFAAPVVSAHQRELRLINGLRVTLVEYPIFPVTALAMTFGTGSRDDPPGRSGLAHLVEHLMFRRTDRFQVAMELERIGASFNATTSSNRTVFYETFPSQFTEQVLRLEADRRTATVFSAADLETESRIIAEEGLSVAPGLTVSEARHFYAARYALSNARLTVVSDVGFDDLTRMIERAFSSRTSLLEPSPAVDAEETLAASIDNDSPGKLALALAALDDIRDRALLLQQSGWMANNAGRQSYKRLREVLPNGMTVLLLSHPAFRLWTIEGYVRAGTYLDGPARRGLASLVARTMTLRARKVESTGLRFSAVTFNTYIEARVASANGPAFIENLAALVSRPLEGGDLVEQARAQLLQDLDRRSRSPEIQAFISASQRSFPVGHPSYLSSPEAQAESVRTLPPAEVTRFHREHYAPAGSILVLVGDFRNAELMTVIRRAFAGWTIKQAVREIRLPRVRPAANPMPATIAMTSAGRAHILLSHPGMLRRRDPDYYACLVANAALGASVLSSRLGTELRDRQGLVYEVRSQFFEATRADGLWGIAMDTRPDRATQAVAAARSVVGSLVRNGVTAEELELHRAATTGAFAVSLSIPLALAGRILDAEFFGLGAEYLQQFEKELRSLTVSDVNRAIRRHFQPDRLLEVRVAP